jgi:hypothetical protein
LRARIDINNHQDTVTVTLPRGTIHKEVIICLYIFFLSYPLWKTPGEQGEGGGGLFGSFWSQKEQGEPMSAGMVTTPH